MFTCRVRPVYAHLRLMSVDGNQLCEMGHVCLDSRCQSMQEQRVVRWWHLAMEVQRILSKTIDMCGEVGAQPGQDLFVDLQ
jgi:hypothetical protein